ncbi:MAG: DUF1311 domain-containing protein [Proteobacteria bacterium]|nr:DUF1311 domain-containing protein [Pseudomonadota bacterium]
MKIGFLSLLAALAMTAPVFAAEACYDTAQSQGDLNVCASTDLAKADRELNDIYAQIRRQYKDDKVFLARLQRAQQAWIAFRDAEFEAHYPAQDKIGNYGTSFGLCAPQLKAQLTRKRSVELRAWLDGAKEGDVCAGSMKIHGADTD